MAAAANVVGSGWGGGTEEGQTTEQKEENGKGEDEDYEGDGEDDEDDGEEETPSKKRGGRGRKPPTTAMNTVPNANLDAKSLLKGLKRGI